MMRMIRSAGSALTTAATALALLATTACNAKQELLAPQQPGVILPGNVQSPVAAEGLYNGAVGNFKQGLLGGNTNQETIWQFTGLFTDEYRSSDTFSQRNDADQRVTQTSDAVLGPLYVTLQQTRGFARNALLVLQQFEPTTSLTKQAEMYFAIGFAEIQLGEAFCNGIPLSYTVNGIPHYTNPMTDSAVFALASAQLDSGLALATGTDAATTQIKDALLIAKGRAQLDLAQFSAAAVTVASVPVGFQYAGEYSQTTNDNGWWVMTTNSKRYSVGDSTDATGTITNALPFVSAHDPRVPTSRVGNGFDSTTPYFQQGIWNRDDPVAIVDGLDGQLIQAEAKLNAGDVAGMMSILNSLRASPPTQGIFKPSGTLSALATPSSQSAAMSLFFREKAFWVFGRGQRLGDLRRQMRQYKLQMNQVYEVGAFFKNGQYGSLTQFPVPDSERSNPNFHGCLDTNP
jgi:starch-binding outer membrane protein, SusD/RagB family